VEDLMGEQKQIPAQLMVAIDPHALEALRSEMAALRAEGRAARITSLPEWIDAGEYARQLGVTRRTVMNRIAAGEIDSRRVGSKTQVRGPGSVGTT